MVFNSYIFILLFMPLAIGGYFFLNKYCDKNKEKAGVLWLLVISFLFYAYDDVENLCFLALSIVFNYMIGQKIGSIREVNGKMPIFKRRLLSFGIICNLLPLGYLKYSNFLLETVACFWGKEWEIDVSLPIGISFVTFMQIAYLVDCYREDGGYSYSLGEYASYVAFFPKIVMGPIALHSDIIPQFRDSSKRKVNYENLIQGFYEFALGLAKKVLIADVLAKFVNDGFGQVESLNSATALMVMLCYTLQLYFDFSGYCDMAMGVAKMLNIDLPMNFNSPYKAKSISEFWDRWHMTLTQFFTRYVYIPLGGSRKGKIRTYVNTMIVFLLSGLWHGANWTFVLWGLLHGAFMCMEKMVQSAGMGLKKATGFTGKILSCIKWLYTFCVVNILWILFRADSIGTAVTFLQRIVSGGWRIHESMFEIFDKLIEVRFLKRIGMESLLEFSMDLTIWGILTMLVLGCVFLKNTHAKIKDNKYNCFRSIVTAVLMVWCIISLSDVSEFLYFNF